MLLGERPELSEKQWGFWFNAAYAVGSLLSKDGAIESAMNGIDVYFSRNGAGRSLELTGNCSNVCTKS